jgi:hypothetical protein
MNLSKAITNLNNPTAAGLEAHYIVIDHIKANAVAAAEQSELMRNLWLRLGLEQDLERLEIVLDGLNHLLPLAADELSRRMIPTCIARLSEMDAPCLAQALPLLHALAGAEADHFIVPYCAHDNPAIAALAMELLD